MPLSTKVTPVGSVPVSDRAAVGFPVVVTVKLPAIFSVKVVLAADVMVGAVPEELTVSVKLWVAAVPTPLVGVKVIGKVPVAVAVPDRTPLAKVTPAGRAPASVMVGAGLPVAVTVKVPAVPWVKVA